MPFFICLCDSSYQLNGALLGELPVGWSPPTHAVDCLTPDAVQAYWNVGPKGQSDASVWQATFTNSARWSGVPVFAPAVYWVRARTETEKGFVLTGAGAGLGVHPPV